ncbi:MAG: NAD(P)/FAD-dependent oxidoreductase, partial [Methyloprofundus sp.]|nr:NAD(P)/FAD-dependent oxidoreductase [Methyloprofundus sp.]
RGESNTEGTIQCRIVVDASGHSSVLAHQMQTRQNISPEFKFLSLWGYFKNSRYVGADAKSHDYADIRRIRPVTFISSHPDGWLWHITLRKNTSIGLIVKTERLAGMTKADREAYYLQMCTQLPYIKDLLKDAEFIDNSLSYRPDYSYYATQTCAANYYCIGDAAGFVDPIFSHGVQNALYNAAVTSLAITESLKKPQRSTRYAALCESRMQQFYGFSRALCLGDFGCNGVNRDLVKSLMKSLPPLELELILTASEMTNRSDNFKKIAQEAGVWERFSGQINDHKLGFIDDLQL